MWLNVTGISVVVALIAALSVWTVYQSESTLRDNLEAKLKTILRIETEAVQQWAKAERQLASFLAADRELAETLLPPNIASGSGGEFLQSYLEEASQKMQNRNCLLMSVDGRVITGSSEEWLAERSRAIESAFRKTSIEEKRHGVPKTLLVEHGDNANGFTLLITTPIVHSVEGTVGFFAVAYDARSELTEVLASSRAGKTGETLAVNEAGFIVSKSRFDFGADQIRIRADAKSNASPVNTSAKAAQLTNRTDQRGVEIVSVSKWLPDLEIQLVTKMDRDEALAPTIQIRKFMWMLCGLLALTTLAAMTYRWHIYRLRTLARQSDLNQKQLGAYELEEKVGEGGMGVVYRAKHALLRRPTAVKILPPEKSSKASIERFEREVKYTSQLKHPNTISIYDYGRTENGLFYYAMELLDGVNLEQLIRHECSLSDGRVIKMLQQVCESLREAHANGLIHRDIKPANIMLCDRGGAVDTIKVLDFGMVRDRSGRFGGRNDSLSGTPAYMAPECFEAPSEVDARIDIFAVGAVGFFLLTGSPMLQASNLNELRREHHSNLGSSTFERLRSFAEKNKKPMDSSLTHLISRCVSLDREDRFGSIEEVLCELSACNPTVIWEPKDAEQWWQRRAESIDDPQSPSIAGPGKSSALNETIVFEHPESKRSPKSNGID
jgi:serine/threonine protein kinase